MDAFGKSGISITKERKRKKKKQINNNKKIMVGVYTTSLQLLTSSTYKMD